MALHERITINPAVRSGKPCVRGTRLTVGGTPSDQPDDGCVSVRLLLDENLSERLLPLPSDRFPDARHVRLLGLGGADDLKIWEQARRDGDLLVRRTARTSQGPIQEPSVYWDGFRG